MNQKSVSIGLIQSKINSDIKDNTYRHMALIREAAEGGAQIVGLQELFNTPYFCIDYNEDHFEWAIDQNDSMFDDFASLAKELDIVLLLPFFEKRADGIYHNSLKVIDADGKQLGIYRKMHIPDDPGFYEKFYFTPGDAEDGYKVFETKYAKIGTLICWDQWYPEAARITALKGADILFFPTAIAILKSESRKDKKRHQEAWHTIQRSHAIANGCFVAAVNRVGKEGKNTFWGHSFVCDPFGGILAQGGEKEEVIVVECDLSQIDQQRREWPFFRDRRIDSYSPILKRFIDD